jgi:hypothetical protein
MHPLIARFLDLEAARETLRREKAGETLSAEEQIFTATAAAHPQQRSEVLGVASRKLNSDAQASLVLLAAHTAARAQARRRQHQGPRGARLRGRQRGGGRVLHRLDPPGGGLWV